MWSLIVIEKERIYRLESFQKIYAVLLHCIRKGRESDKNLKKYGEKKD